MCKIENVHTVVLKSHNLPGHFVQPKPKFVQTISSFDWKMSNVQPLFQALHMSCNFLFDRHSPSVWLIVVCVCVSSF